MARITAGHEKFGTENEKAIAGGNALQGTSTATTVAAGRRGRVHRHRRAVRRDQGSARRLLPGRGGRPGRGDRAGQAGAGALRRPRGPADHGLQLSRTAVTAAAGAAAAAVADGAPSRVGLRARRDGARHARHRPRRGVRPGRLRAGADRLGPRTASRPGRARWLTTAARNRALDVMRRDALFRRAMPELVMDERRAPDRRWTGRRRFPTTGCG